MNSLKDVYQTMIATEQEKVAEETQQDVLDEGMLKQAAEYETVGRILARSVWDDLVKQAEAFPFALAEQAEKAPKSKKKDEEDEDEDEDEESEDEESEDEEEEKKASVKAEILNRMAQDPEYVAALVSKYMGR